MEHRRRCLKLILLYFLNFIIAKSVTLEFRPYDIIWNAPTIDCKSRFGVNVDPTPYGIRENDQNGLIGNVITLLYVDNTGLYPYYTSNGTAVNGGLPQLTNMTAHLIKLESDLEKTIPNKTFDGYGILDWESWRPLWDRNWDEKEIYRTKSMDLVKKQHPTWSKDRIELEAKNQFETAARNIIESSLSKCKSLRPSGQWGFYLFPECYNYDGDRTCPNETKEENNQLLWLFNASTALFPSAYLPSKLDEAQRYTFVHGQISEAQRVRSVLKKDKTLPIYLYTRFQLAESAIVWYTQQDLQAAVFEPSVLGVDGIIVWGDGKNSRYATNCSSVEKYLTTRYGPFSKNVINSANNCSRILCNSHGRCVLNETYHVRTVSHPTRLQYNYNLQDSALDRYYSTVVNDGLSAMKNGLNFTYLTTMYSCQCFASWKGAQCDKPS